MKFDELVNSKYSELGDGILEEQPNQPVQAGQPQAGSTQTGQQPQQQQQQPQQQQQQQQDEQLAAVLKGIPYGSPDSALTVFNNALKRVGNVQGMKEFFSTIGYDATKNVFAKAGSQQQNQPAQNQQAQNQQGQ